MPGLPGSAGVDVASHKLARRSRRRVDCGSRQAESAIVPGFALLPLTARRREITRTSSCSAGHPRSIGEHFYAAHISQVLATLRPLSYWTLAMKNAMDIPRL